MNETTPDAAPLRGPQLAASVHQLILRHPEKHKQSWWLARDDTQKLCASEGCVAGWTAVLAHPDLRPHWDDGESSTGFLCDDAHQYNIDELATAALNLSSGQAHWLFDASRTRREVLSALLRLSRGENALPKQLRADYDYE
jgi:hypothetical protein